MDDFSVYTFTGWCLDVGHLYLFSSAFNVSFDLKTTLFSPSLYLFFYDFTVQHLLLYLFLHNLFSIFSLYLFCYMYYRDIVTLSKLTVLKLLASQVPQ